MSNLLLFIFDDENGKRRYINLGYLSTKTKEVNNKLHELKNRKLSTK